MVTDASLVEGSYVNLIAEARRLNPTLRVILVAPASRPPPPSLDPKAGPDTVLLRPFRIHQFAEALSGPQEPRKKAETPASASGT